jgi:hypothetical protein
VNGIARRESRQIRPSFGEGASISRKQKVLKMPASISLSGHGHTYYDGVVTGFHIFCLAKESLGPAAKPAF